MAIFWVYASDSPWTNSIITFAITTVPQIYLITGGLDWSTFTSGKDSKDSSLGTNYLGPDSMNYACSIFNTVCENEGSIFKILALQKWGITAFTLHHKLQDITWSWTVWSSYSSISTGQIYIYWKLVTACSTFQWYIKEKAMTKALCISHTTQNWTYRKLMQRIIHLWKSWSTLNHTGKHTGPR